MLFLLHFEASGFLRLLILFRILLSLILITKHRNTAAFLNMSNGHRGQAAVSNFGLGLPATLHKFMLKEPAPGALTEYSHALANTALPTLSVFLPPTRSPPRPPVAHSVPRYEMWDLQLAAQYQQQHQQLTPLSPLSPTKTGPPPIRPWPDAVQVAIPKTHQPNSKRNTAPQPPSMLDKRFSPWCHFKKRRQIKTACVCCHEGLPCLLKE